MASRRDMLIAAGLALAVIACYAQVSGHEFVNYDDHRYITHNPHVQQGLTFENIGWAFTTFDVANWHPLTWLSHMADVNIFRADNPGGHHLVNVLLHAVNAILLFALLQRMTGASGGWRSAIVAALFALHPLRVESVAWASERKDLLSACFALLAMRVYVSYAANRSIKSYLLMTALFAFSLMSKPMFVTLPALLLVLDWWPLRRFQTPNLISESQISHVKSQMQIKRGATLGTLIIEKLPLLAMSLASSVITVMAQKSGGAVSGLEAVGVVDRISNAVVAYAMYLRQMVWPVDLAPLYPLPEQWPVVLVIGSLLVLIVISMMAIALSRKRPALLAGWLWYLGTLVPVIGLVQVGSQAHADRYTYFPMIGVLIMIIWNIPSPGKKGVIVGYGAVATVMIATLMGLTWNQTHHWRNSIALSEHALRVTTDNGFAHFNLGNAYMDAGRLDEAVEQFKIAGDIMPNWPDAPFNLGNALAAAGRADEAIKAFDEALRRDPKFTDALNNRGIVRAQQLGLHDAAIADFLAALAINPDDVQAHMNLGQTFMQQEQLDAALQHFSSAAQLQPGNSIAHLMRGNVLAMLQRFDVAVQDFARSLELDPGNPHAHMSMASALAETGRIDQALAHLNAAAQIAQATGDHALLAEVQRRMQRFRIPPP